MRKFIMLLMTAVLCLNLAIGAWAAGDALTIPDVQVKKDQTIYVAVSFNESVTGDSLGISYSYDTGVLEAIPGSASWGKQGMLQDFSRNDSGVWAVGEPTDLKGTVCVLAFRVKDGAELTDTQVTCTVTVKNDADIVGTFTAAGKLYAVCDHSYGNWTSAGPLSHTRNCIYCGVLQTQTHSWNSGVVSDHPTDPHKDLKTFTCQLCRETRVEEIADQGNLPQVPTVPELPTEAPTEPEAVTQPTETTPPATKPTEPRQEQTNPTAAPTAPAPTETQAPTKGQQSSKDPTVAPGNGDNLTDFNKPDDQSGSKEPTTGHNPAPTVPAPTESEEADQTQPGEPTEVPGETEQDAHAGPTERPVAVTMPPTEAPEVTAATEIHDHTHEATLPTEQTHDHTHEEPAPQVTGSSVLALGAAVVLLVLAAVLAAVLLKRIKRK